MNLSKCIQVIFYIGMSFALVSCVGVVKIPVYALSPDSTKITALKSKYGKTEFDQDLKACKNDVCRKTARNLILNELVLLTDYYYQTYEGNMIAGKARSDFGFGMASTALSLASAVSTVEDSKTIISTIASLASSTRTEIDKNFYHEQTTQALIVKMRALRTVKKLALINGSFLSYEQYPLERGLGDFFEYYRAGTMANAVQSIYEYAAEQNGNAHKRIDEIQEAKAAKAYSEAGITIN
jgi:hypothetical protein